MFETDIRQVVSQDPGVLEQLQDVDRVYLGMIPKGQPDSPAVVLRFRLIKAPAGYDGANGLKFVRVQADSYDASYPKAAALSKSVSDCLLNVKGALSTTSTNGGLLRMDEDMGKEPGDNGYVFRRLIAIDFSYTEN